MSCSFDFTHQPQSREIKAITSDHILDGGGGGGGGAHVQAKAIYWLVSRLSGLGRGSLGAEFLTCCAKQFRLTIDLGTAYIYTYIYIYMHININIYNYI